MEKFGNIRRVLADRYYQTGGLLIVPVTTASLDSPFKTIPAIPS